MIPKLFGIQFLPASVDHCFLQKYFQFFRYRHYGVYLTHEEDQLVDGDDVLRNPVVVLDKNSESYINLRYPIHSKEDSELTKGLTPAPPVKTTA